MLFYTFCAPCYKFFSQRTISYPYYNKNKG